MRAKMFSLLLLLSVPVFADKPVIPIQSWSTNNGVRVLYVYAEQLPMVDIKTAFYAGSAYDGKHPGLAQLTNALLDEGTSTLSADAIAEAFAKSAAQYSTTVDRDYATVSLRSLSNEALLAPALQIYSTVLSQASFPESAFQRTLAKQMTAIKFQQQNPRTIANDTFFRSVYPHHPYAHPIIGTLAALNQITLTDVKRFYKRFYVARNAVIAIVGKVDYQRAKKIAERIASQLPLGMPAAELATPHARKQGVRKRISFPSSQTKIQIGTPTIAKGNPDFYPLTIGNYLLGGGMVSKLYQAIRQQRGLSYDVGSHLQPMRVAGPFQISFSSRNERASEALEVAMSTLRRFLAKPPSESEMASAKAYLQGNFPLNFDSNREIANIILTIGIYHLPLNYLDNYLAALNRVTAEDVHKAFNRYLKLDKLTTVLVGKPNAGHL